MNPMADNTFGVMIPKPSPIGLFLTDFVAARSHRLQAQLVPALRITGATNNEAIGPIVGNIIVSNTGV